MTITITLPSRLQAQLRFLAEADRLKTVLRATRISDNSRQENTAEHSWHLSLFALVLSEWAIPPIDLFRVVQMLILHDLVEIECGDTPLLSGADPKEQARQERLAADRLFGILPQDQSDLFRMLWEEFEAVATPDSRFAKALDRFQPLQLNQLTNGGTWVDFHVSESREKALTQRIEDGAPRLWQAALEIYADAVSKGWIAPAER